MAVQRMRRYEVQLVIREEGVPGEKVVDHVCMATTQLDARRNALNRAYREGVLVSQFLEVRPVE
jgi:hypothetical protein